MPIVFCLQQMTSTTEYGLLNVRVVYKYESHTLLVEGETISFTVS